MFTLAKTVLDPEMIPAVAIDFMNNTHLEEVVMVRNIGDLVSTYQKNTQSITQSIADEENKIMLITKDWLEHTEAHFSRENELMEKYEFPAYEIHANEHEVALARMATVVKRWDEHQDIELLADYVFHLWPKWFNGHVNSMDMMTAQFAVMNGFKPNEVN